MAMIFEPVAPSNVRVLASWAPSSCRILENGLILSCTLTQHAVDLTWKRKQHAACSLHADTPSPELFMPFSFPVPRHKLTSVTD